MIDLLSKLLSKRKSTYIGTSNGVDIYKEKTYAFIFTDEFNEEVLKVFYKGDEINWAILMSGPVDRIEEVENKF